MSWTTGGNLLRTKQERQGEAGVSRRHGGIVLWLAFWRRTPGSRRSCGTLALLAGLALACPVLAAVSVASVAQIIPDFDDADWDGPDDDGWDEKKLASIGSLSDGHSGRQAAAVAAILPASPDLLKRSPRQMPGESHLEAPIGERQGDTPSFRGPPR